jgi:hypothetical protein
LVPRHLEEVSAERLERIAKAKREIKARMQREINHWSRRYEELKLKEQAERWVQTSFDERPAATGLHKLPQQNRRIGSFVAKQRAEALITRLETRLAQLQAEAQITAKVPNLKGGSLVIPAGWLLAQQGQSDPQGVDATARKRVGLLAMNAVFEAEKALGRMPKDVSAERGRGYDIESIDADGNLFFIEVKGRADSADTVTLTINEVNTGRNAPHRFRLALVSVAGDQAAAPVYVSGVDWGLPGFGDTQITKNLQQLLAAGRAPH